MSALQQNLSSQAQAQGGKDRESADASMLAPAAPPKRDNKLMLYGAIAVAAVLVTGGVFLGLRLFKAKDSATRPLPDNASEWTESEKAAQVERAKNVLPWLTSRKDRSMVYRGMKELAETLHSQVPLPWPSQDWLDTRLDELDQMDAMKEASKQAYPDHYKANPNGKPNSPGQFMLTLESISFNEIARTRESRKQYYLKYKDWGPPGSAGEKNMESILDTLAVLDIAKIMLANSKNGPKQAPTKDARRRLMGRLLRYEAYYSSGKEGHPSMRSA
jgi:hypothetical protein